MSDQTYAQASMSALGRNIAEIWQGLVDGGMSRKEALVVICAYVRGLASQGKSPESAD